MKEEIEVTNNKENLQFEVRLDGHMAELVYRVRGNSIYLMHTGVPEPIGGRGIASELAKHALNYSQSQGYEIVVYCPFVKAYIEKHPEWKAKISSISI